MHRTNPLIKHRDAKLPSRYSKTVHECTLRLLCNRSSALILHLARGKLIGNGADKMTA